MKALARRILRLFGLDPHWLVVVIALGVFPAGCGEGTAPSAVPSPTPSASCNVTISGQAVTVTGPICGDGNGSVNNPPASTPAPTPGASSCEQREVHYYETIVVQALARVPPRQAMDAHIASLASLIRGAGLQVQTFAANSPDTVSRDEIAVKASNGFSETYDVWQGDFTAGSPHVLYIQTCSPARF